MEGLPSGFHRFFRWFCRTDFYEELQGDMEEAFVENVDELGLAKAQAIYRKEVLKMLRPSVLKHTQKLNQHIMTLPKNYLKTSLRAIKLHPFYVTANVVGLAMALSICTIAYFNYRYNITFNDYFEEAASLYKIHGDRTGESAVGTTSIALAPALRNSDISAGRYLKRSLTLKDGDRMFNARLAFVDQEFLELLPLHNLDDKQLQAPEINQIMISEKLALKLFDEPYPVGELIKVIFPTKEEGSFMISEVIKTAPTNTSFVQDAMLNLEAYLHYFRVEEQDWSRSVNGTFVRAADGEKGRIEAALAGFLPIRNEKNPSTVIEGYRLDNLQEWPRFENSLYRSSFRAHLNQISVYGITGSAIAILLLACFNYINTSIALSGKRLKEIAVRKILGGTRLSTTTQFLIENTFMISLAVLVSFGISFFLIPEYNALMRSDLIQMDQIPYQDILLFCLGILAIVTVLAAAYPSIYISKFSALKIFQKKLTLSGKNVLMAVLLTFQFALCFYNIFGLFLNTDNINYQAALDRGYDVSHVVNVPLNRVNQYQAMEQALLESPDVVQVAGARNLIGFSDESKTLLYEGVETPVSVINVGKDYPQALGLRLSKGSYFERSSEDRPEILINQMLEDTYGEDLLNKQLLIGDQKYQVVGVVDDFNVKSIMGRNKITPTVIALTPPQLYYNVAVKINGSADAANKEIERIWYEIYPNELYEGFTQALVMENARELNRVFFKINLFLAIITILVSILGLYTLISLKIQRKSKEFGVRKVLGASKATIVHLLGKDLYWMIGIAAMLGLTGGSLVLKTVYDLIYAYHVDPQVPHFVKAIIIVMLIIVTTVGYQVYRASLLNPTQQLRSE